MDFSIIDPTTGEHDIFTDEKVISFLHDHLEQYGDNKEDIGKCLQYMYSRGGFITVGHEGESIKGIVVINDTQMTGYIPDHILVYIAVDRSTRGQGFGRKLMETVLERCKGDVALHVEPDNPAKFLYENLGFTNKYLEMRYRK